MLRILRLTAILLVLSMAGCTDRSTETHTTADPIPWSDPADTVADTVVTDDASGDQPGARLSSTGHLDGPAAVSDPDATTGAGTMPSPTSDVASAGDLLPGPELVPATGLSSEGSDVSRWLEQMSSDARIERRAAVEALDAIGEEVFPHVVDKLRNGKLEQQRGAARYLIGRVSPNNEQAADELIEALAAKDPELRHAALQAVERLSPEQLQRALSSLVAMLEDQGEEEAYRSRAARAIGKLDEVGRPAVPALVTIARKDSSQNVQLAVFATLSKVASPQDCEDFFLEELAGDGTPDLRRLAAKWLGRTVHSERTIVGLAAAFSDPEKDVRMEATDSLVGIGKPAVSTLIKSLQLPDVQVRRYSVMTLGKLGKLSADATPAIEKCLSDSDEQVRQLAAAALKLINVP